MVVVEVISRNQCTFYPRRDSISIDLHRMLLFQRNLALPLSNRLSPYSQFIRFSTSETELSVATGDAIPLESTLRSPFQGLLTFDTGSLIRCLWPSMCHSSVTNALWEATSKMYGRMGNVNSNASASASNSSEDSELVPRCPARSRTSIVYRFSKDCILREQCRNLWNEVRMGKLAEDLDVLAGTICYKRCYGDDGTMRALLLVTASVDRMVLKKLIHIDADLTIEGTVIWVEHSLMEIQLEVTQI